MSWSSPKFEIGEVVSLQSDKKANPMTIEIVSDEMIGCVWFDRTGRIRHENFPRACLKQSSDADISVVFMPEPMMNEEGVQTFLSGDYHPGEVH